MAISLSNVQAFGELDQRAGEKTAQLTVDNALLSMKDGIELFLTVATELNRLVPFDRFMLWLKQPDGQTQGFAELVKPPTAVFSR